MGALNGCRRGRRGVLRRTLSRGLRQRAEETVIARQLRPSRRRRRADARGGRRRGALPHAPVERLDVGGEGGAVEQPIGELLRLQARPQGAAAGRVLGEADHRRAVAFDIGAHQLGQAGGAQQARGDALGEGRGPRSSPPARRPTAPRPPSCGRCTARHRGRCRHRRAGSGGPEAARAARTRAARRRCRARRPPSSAPPGRWCSIAAARAWRRAARAAARTTGRTPRARSCTTGGRRRAAAPPRARPSRHASRAAAGRGARRSAGSNAAAGRSSR